MTNYPTITLTGEWWVGETPILEESIPETDKRIIAKIGLARVTRFTAKWMDEDGWPSTLAYAAAAAAAGEDGR